MAAAQSPENVWLPNSPRQQSIAEGTRKTASTRPVLNRRERYSRINPKQRAIPGTYGNAYRATSTFAPLTFSTAYSVHMGIAAHRTANKTNLLAIRSRAP